jgi:hypothetical protein
MALSIVMAQEPSVLPVALLLQNIPQMIPGQKTARPKWLPLFYGTRAPVAGLDVAQRQLLQVGAEEELGAVFLCIPALLLFLDLQNP